MRQAWPRQCPCAFWAKPARCHGNIWTENIYFLTRLIPCGRQAWNRKCLCATRRGPCVAHPPAELSLSKCPAERNSMQHGCPLFPIGLNFFPHLHKFGWRVLTTCKIALALPCTTWHCPGPRLASRPSAFVKISLKFRHAARALPDFFGSVTKALVILMFSGEEHIKVCL